MVYQHALFLGILTLGVAAVEGQLWGRSELAVSEDLKEDKLWEFIDNDECYAQSTPVEAHEGVDELLQKYYHEFDNTRLKDHIPVFFTHEASMHLVMPVIPDRYFFGGSLGPVANDGLGKWEELHLKGVDEIEKSTKKYLSDLPEHATKYRIRLMEPAISGATYVLVSGIMKVEGQRLERFVQNFLIVRDRGSHFKHKIRFTTITGGMTHRCAPKPDIHHEE